MLIFNVFTLNLLNAEYFTGSWRKHSRDNMNYIPVVRNEFAGVVTVFSPGAGEDPSISLKSRKLFYVVFIELLTPIY